MSVERESAAILADMPCRDRELQRRAMTRAYATVVADDEGYPDLHAFRCVAARRYAWSDDEFTEWAVGRAWGR